MKNYRVVGLEIGFDKKSNAILKDKAISDREDYTYKEVKIIVNHFNNFVAPGVDYHIEKWDGEKWNQTSKE